MSHRSLLAHALTLLLIAALCVGTVVMARRGIADYYARQGEIIMDSWSEDTAPSDASVNEVIRLSEQALSYAPTHPTYLHRLGQMHSALQRRDPIGNAAHGEISLKYLRDSSAARPQWPHTWAELVLIKVASEQFDVELHEAILKATRYGPWEPIVHKLVTQAGIVAYAQLPAGVQTAVRGNIERGLRSPGPGQPMRVVRALRGSVKGLTLDLVWDLGLFMSGTEWPRHSLSAMTDVTLFLWPVFSPDLQQQLTVKLSQAAVLDPGRGVLNQLQKSGQLALVCPHLPREPRYRRFCSERTVLGR